ncbi:MAG: 4Fe-4S dicluster domain-containing protein [Deltaproteobacteria bacterium]|nr:4Fe-4S dicluster domain-containing protein [Deltaproteobacteria bacterium]
MQEYTAKIRDTARRLFAEDRVDVVVGFKRGTVPMMCQPVLITGSEEVDTLHWDSFCSVNLANYLPKRQDRLAIVAKGCDARNIVVHLLENQIRRDQIFVIGVPCTGMVDRRKVTKGMSDADILEVTENGSKITAKGRGVEESFSKAEVLQDNCAICIHRNPVIFDELVGEPVVEQAGIDRYADVRDVEAMGVDDRSQHFQDLVASCIRCYACRDVCPLCYCPTCFVDESKPQWLGKSIDPKDTLTFHLLRAFHCAGRCTDCGACEQVCPVGIKMRQFTKKLEKDVLDLYGHEAGMTLESRPPLDVYQPDDPEEFIE